MKSKYRNAKKNRRKSSSKIGLPPGTIVHLGEVLTEKPSLRVTDYNAREVEHVTISNTEDVFKFLQDNDKNTWVRFTGLHETDKITLIGNKLDIHPLVLEDVVNTSQRPKVEGYDDYIFIVVKHLQLSEDRSSVESRQVSFILSRQCVISFHEHEDTIFDTLKPRIEIPNGRFRKYGSDYLMYALIDLVVDNYFTVLDELMEEVAVIEESMMDISLSTDYARLHNIRRKLIQMRRHIMPMRDMLTMLMRDETPLISDEIRVYMRDVFDHLNRVTDGLDHTIELVATLIDTHMTQVNIRTGEVMKVLTIIATIFIPLTFIVGIYGMNFNPEASPFNMPELDWYYGYPATMGFMLMVSLGMLLWFRKRRWI